MDNIFENILPMIIIDNTWDLTGSYLLEGPLGEKLVYAVCKWIVDVSIKGWKKIGETVIDIIEEFEGDEE